MAGLNLRGNNTTVETVQKQALNSKQTCASAACFSASYSVSLKPYLQEYVSLVV